MKPFELLYTCAEPFRPPLYRHVRKRLKALAREHEGEPQILDVGGRKSHYTVGIPGRIVVTDLPRETDLQHRLGLGINSDIAEQTLKRRSNVREVLLDDMTQSSLPDCSFDCIVSVEVLEHVEEDDLFLRNVHRLLKPGGRFLMTTPNGDHVKNTNPDHKRHYTREQLHRMLSSLFEDVDVEYAIRGGRYRALGLKSWSMKRPSRTILSIVGNVINGIQSSGEALKRQPRGTHHLIATARKPGRQTALS